MAAPTIGLLGHTSISTAESTTGWTTFDTLDSDIKKEGSNGITGTFRNDGASGHYNAGSAPVTAANKHVRMWVNTTSVPYLDTAANGGFEFHMNDGTTTEYYTIFSSDDYYGGWFNMVVDCDLFTTLTLANVEQWGVRVQYTTSAKNVDNVWVDYIRYLDGYYITGGTSGDKVELSDVATADRGTTTLYGYGIVLEQDGVFFAYGEFQVGNGATTTYFEMDNEVLVFVDAPVGDGLYAINGNGSGANILINGSTIKADGTATATQYDFDMSTGSPGTVVVTDNVFIRGGTFTFGSGQTVTGNTFSSCEQITHGGADMDDCTILGYEGTANTSALIYDVNADPDGEMDGMTFEKGTAATHAIEFGTNVPATMTLRDCTFTGYNASDTQNDSTFHFKDTSGTITLNLVGCTGNFSYRSDGATIVISIDPVTQTVNVKNTDGDNIQNARVFVETAATIASGEIFEAAVTSLTQSAGTATCTTTAAHGLATNDYVVVRGAQPDTYNKVAQVTVSSTTVFTYAVDSGSSSPATGTPVVSFMSLYGLTDANGNISSTRTWGAAQQVKGWARKKNTVSPFYKDGNIAYAVDNSNGNTINVVLQPDE